MAMPAGEFGQGDDQREGRQARAERPGSFEVLTSLLGPVGVELNPAKSHDTGTENDRRLKSSKERPGIFEVLTSLCPVRVELDPTQSHDTGTEDGRRLKWSQERRVSVAKKLNTVLRAATEKIVANAKAKQKNGDVNGLTGDTQGRIVRRAARPSRRVKQTASRKASATGDSKARRKPQKRNADESEADSRRQPQKRKASAAADSKSRGKPQKRKADESEADSRRQQQKKRKTQKAPEGAPPGTYYDPRLSRVAPIYHDVVAGEKVLVNYIADDPCPWESPDELVPGPCQGAVTPDNYFDRYGRINYWYRIPEEQETWDLLTSAARKLRRFSRRSRRR
ncbi:uncharacterized protein LOC118419437 [Branchiostoma floridae]|uniref:Uncharacterized protein LOC118419437 n=1 Tax=Branchiostoma floridae TaxID=7739 RepID=A0A9J7MVP9_BRAFL|nr:uncharacterized protein LOC118419437 [Branchiostoma floridae]